jgi:hypothetical protein
LDKCSRLPGRKDARLFKLSDRTNFRLWDTMFARDIWGALFVAGIRFDVIIATRD